jgi:acyl dehydratase
MPGKYVGKYFDELEIGEIFETAARTVTEADIVNFTGLSWDIHPLHNDEEFSKKSIYGRRIAQGFLVLSMMGGLTTCSGIMEASRAFMGMEKWSLHKPVFAGDTLRCRLKVFSKKATCSGERGVVTFEREVLNQRDEIVQSGYTAHLFVVRPEQK